MSDTEITVQPLIEQTSSSENHYELMAIATALWDWFGLDREKPFLEQMSEDLHAIRMLMEESWSASELLREEAQKALDAHAKSAQEYLRELDEPLPTDWHPFTAVPPGTQVKDLSDGGRLFVLSDGAFVRVRPDSSMYSVDADGDVHNIDTPTGGKVTLPDGRVLSLDPQAVTATHQAAGISGLPQSCQPVQASDGRFSVTLPDGTRLDVLQDQRLAVLINTSGAIGILGISRTEGIGEDVSVRLISGGAKSFRCSRSGHAGMIESDGTIHLSVSTGEDLVIRFPDTAGGGEPGSDETGPICFDCEELA